MLVSSKKVDAARDRASATVGDFKGFAIDPVSGRATLTFVSGGRISTLLFDGTETSVIGGVFAASPLTPPKA